jgi:hypothetical protein
MHVPAVAGFRQVAGSKGDPGHTGVMNRPREGAGHCWGHVTLPLTLPRSSVGPEVTRALPTGRGRPLVTTRATYAPAVTKGGEGGVQSRDGRSASGGAGPRGTGSLRLGLTREVDGWCGCDNTQGCRDCHPPLALHSSSEHSCSIGGTTAHTRPAVTLVEKLLGKHGAVRFPRRSCSVTAPRSTPGPFPSTHKVAPGAAVRDSTPSATPCTSVKLEVSTTTSLNSGKG